MHEGKYSASAIRYAGLALVQDSSPFGNSWVSDFEAEFAKFSGSKFAISVNSATSGLHSALLAVGVGPGDEVISPGLTVVMDAYATLFCGATPVFADVDPETWNLDPVSVESLISPKTKAILNVSWFGRPGPLRQLRELADRFGLALIDDSAETMLMPAEQDEEWGLADLRVFSFESKKHFSTGGEGGMVVTDSSIFAEAVRKFAGIGYRHLGASKGRTHLAARDFQNPEYLRFDTIGFNYRMTPVAAAIGIGQLENVHQFLTARRTCANLFREAIGGYAFFEPQLEHPSHSYYTFGIRFRPELAKGWSWQRVYDRVAQLGGDGFYANCMNPYLEPSLIGRRTNSQVLERGLCPVSEELQKSIMAFKTNYLDSDSLRRNADVINKVCLEISGE